MNEKLLNFKKKLIDFWNTRTKTQKGIIIGSSVSIMILLILVSIFAFKPNLVPLYSNLSPQETGQIKATLDSRGIQSEITSGGTQINVPKALVDSLKVDLAAEGIPDSGEIYFSSFGEGGFGITQEELELRKNAAVQSELKRLIKRFEGVQDAEVMISLPEKSLFVGEEQGTASASIVIYQKPGYNFENEQIEGLYHLVSKSVSNLPIENIVITNQYFQYLDSKNLYGSKKGEQGVQFADQYEIQKQIERDIRQQVQQMLGLMMGRDKVIVTVTANIDASKVNSERSFVEPIDQENTEGIAISAERISETFEGNGDLVGGITGTGETDVPNTYVQQNGQMGDYENIEERINYEVNRIKETVVGSPYKVDDLGIQVAIDSEGLDEQTMLALTPEIENMLNGIIRTTISDNNINLDGRVNVTWQEFKGIQTLPKPTFMDMVRNNLVWILAGLLILLAIIFGFVLFMRKNKKNQLAEEPLPIDDSARLDIPDVNEKQETESGARRKQLEKMAKEKPDEFAKLLRSWLSED